MCLRFDLNVNSRDYALWLKCLVIFCAIFSFVYWFVLCPLFFSHYHDNLAQDDQIWPTWISLIIAFVIWSFVMLTTLFMWCCLRTRKSTKDKNNEEMRMMKNKQLIKNSEMLSSSVRRKLGIDDDGALKGTPPQSPSGRLKRTASKQVQTVDPKDVDFHSINLDKEEDEEDEKGKNIKIEVDLHEEDREGKDSPEGGNLFSRLSSRRKKRLTVEIPSTEITVLPDFSPKERNRVFTALVMDAIDREKSPELRNKSPDLLGQDDGDEKRERRRSSFNDFLHLVQIDSPGSPEEGTPLLAPPSKEPSPKRPENSPTPPLPPRSPIPNFQLRSPPIRSPMSPQPTHPISPLFPPQSPVFTRGPLPSPPHSPVFYKAPRSSPPSDSPVFYKAPRSSPPPDSPVFYKAPRSSPPPDSPVFYKAPRSSPPPHSPVFYKAPRSSPPPDSPVFYKAPRSSPPRLPVAPRLPAPSPPPRTPLTPKPPLPLPFSDLPPQRPRSPKPMHHDHPESVSKEKTPPLPPRAAKKQPPEYLELLDDAGENSHLYCNSPKSPRDAFFNDLIEAANKAEDRKKRVSCFEFPTGTTKPLLEKKLSNLEEKVWLLENKIRDSQRLINEDPSSDTDYEIVDEQEAEGQDVQQEVQEQQKEEAEKNMGENEARTKEKGFYTDEDIESALQNAVEKDNEERHSLSDEDLVSIQESSDGGEVHKREDKDEDAENEVSEGGDSSSSGSKYEESGKPKKKKKEVSTRERRFSELEESSTEEDDDDGEGSRNVKHTERPKKELVKRESQVHLGEIRRQDSMLSEVSIPVNDDGRIVGPPVQLGKFKMLREKFEAQSGKKM